MTQTSPTIPDAAVPVESKTERIRRFSLAGRNLQSVALIPVIIAVCILGALISPHFFTPTNIINNVLALSAPLAILVIAESVILVGGYFDLSLQSTVGFSVMVFAVLITAPATGTRGYGLPLPVALLITLGVVLLIGLLNGFFVSVLKLNAFIVTLAMLILIQGVTLGISNGQTYTDLPGFVLWLGTASVFGLPDPGAHLRRSVRPRGSHHALHPDGPRALRDGREHRGRTSGRIEHPTTDLRAVRCR